MTIRVVKLTDYPLLQRAAWFTSGAEIKAPLGKWYDANHSPVRTQLFWVEMEDIPSFVSVHLVRHSQGVTHFVRSNREDRGGVKGANRLTPVAHAMIINAEALMTLGHKRLCGKASKETREVVNQIKWKLREFDPELADLMVPLCVYRGGRCTEFKPCGYAAAQKGEER